MATPATQLDPDYNGPPLRTQMAVRMSVPMHAQIKIRALIEGTEPSKIARRWLRAGAAAEGFDLDTPL